MNINNQIKLSIKNFKYYYYMFVSVPNSWLKVHYLNLLFQELILLEYLFNKYEEKSVLLEPSKKLFNLEELSYYDGSKGRPAYVAVEGKVYDVTLNYAWGGGTHFGLYAGRDLTEELKSCHKKEILNNLPQVGVLVR